MQSTNVNTTITGLSVATPAASNSTHFHIKIKDNTLKSDVNLKNNRGKLDVQRDKPDSKKNKSFKIDKSFLKND